MRNFGLKDYLFFPVIVTVKVCVSQANKKERGFVLREKTSLTMNV